MRAMRVIAAAFLILAATPVTAGAKSITDGKARFEVITPSLIRLQYAADGKFDNNRTQTTSGRLRSSARFRTRVRGGRRVIRTSRLTLRWRRGSGPFSASNLTAVIERRGVHPALGPNPSPL